jgi:hypothetical protein
MTQEKTVDASAPIESVDEELKAAIEKRNRDLDAYYDKQANLVVIADEIRQLAGASGTGVAKVLSTMSDIESRLELIDQLFVELGRVPDSGDYFEAGEYQHVMLERRIANRKIRDIDEIPEAFRDDFRHLCDEDGTLHTDALRDTDAIRDDLGNDLEELGYMLERVDDFSCYLPAGRTRGSPKLDALRDRLDTLWDEFRSAARSVAYHF